MGNKYRFSIIIPVYNTEEYLQECITSVLGQNFANYEIILVNDGSTDRSPEKCDEYAAKYANISVIHQKNKGPSAARNKGVQCAQGEYLLFLDSDDRYCNTELLHKIDICAEDSDIVAFNHIEAPDYEAVCKVQKGTKKFNTEHKNGKEFLRDALEQDYYTRGIRVNMPIGENTGLKKVTVSLRKEYMRMFFLHGE